MGRVEVTAEDEGHMGHALRLARGGLGSTYPNPCVGALVVAGGRVLGSARSAPTGGMHAETRALAKAGSKARGATLYVTLEPCAHHGFTPPCVEAIIAAGIRKVLVGVRDPAKHVAGKGVSTLRRRGIIVVEGVLAEQCARVHEHYLHHEKTGIPFVTLKVAMSQDGQIATVEGDSRWITGTKARREGHRLRALHHAIAVGAQTVMKDDPRLDVRLVRGTDPIPVVFDSRLTMVAKGMRRLRVLKPGTLVLHLRSVSKQARMRLAATGAEGIECPPDARGHIDVAAALAILGRRKIRSILVEGGGHLHASFVQLGLWQRLVVFQAPVFLGEGRPFLPQMRWERVADALAPVVQTRRFLDEDLMVVFTPPSPGKKRAR